MNLPINEYYYFVGCEACSLVEYYQCFGECSLS